MNNKAFYLNIVSTAILTVIFAFGGMFFPLFSTFFWAAPIGVLTAREGLKPGLLAGVLSFVILALLISPQWAASSALQFAGIGLVMGHYLSKGGSFREVLLKTAAVSLVLTFLLYMLPYLHSNATRDLGAELSKNIDSVIAMWNDMGLMESLNQQEMSIVELKESLQTAVSWFIRLLPSLLVIFALGAAFFNFLGARWALKKKGYSLPEFPGFIRWWVPWYTSWGVVLGLGLALLGDYVGIDTIFTLGLNLVVLHLPVAVIIGLSVFGFVLVKIKSRLFQAAVIFAGFFYLPLTAVLLLLVGVFDPLFDFRKIHLKRV